MIQQGYLWIFKKCPFCGAEGKVEQEANGEFLMYYIHCAKCGARTGDQTNGYAATIMWNMRYDEAQDTAR